MLKQEINLYQPFTTTRPDKALLTWKQFWISHAIVLTFFTLIYLSLTVKVFFLTRERNQLQLQTIALEKSFNTLKNQYPSIFFSQNIPQTLELMQKNIADERKFLNGLSPHTSFSQKLLALSRISVSNVWLTSISMSNAEQELILKGNMLKSENLQALLLNISHEQLFADFNFNVNNIENLNNKEGSLAFQITMVKKS